jgi:multiple sugar transport system permease protein
MEARVGETFVKRLIVFYIPLFMFLVAMLFPFYWMLVTSIKPDAELYNVRHSPFIVWHPTLEHWVYLFKETLFGRWALNTFWIATASTILSLFCGVLAAYSLSRLKFIGSTTIGVSIFVTYLVPPTLLFIPLSEVVAKLHLSDSPWSLILTYPTFLVPFSTWLLMGYFKTIPKELEECARIDGATRFQAMVRIVFPLATPGILSAGIFSFTLSWNEFLYALVFLSSPEQKTIPVGVVSELIKGDVFFWGSLMAGALFGSVPVAVVYSFFVEHYVSGITGAVKG